jgi:aconitate hydratase
LPFSLKVLLENLLRYEDGRTVTADDVRAIAQWLKLKPLIKKLPIARLAC